MGGIFIPISAKTAMKLLPKRDKWVLKRLLDTDEVSKIFLEYIDDDEMYVLVYMYGVDYNPVVLDVSPERYKLARKIYQRYNSTLPKRQTSAPQPKKSGTKKETSELSFLPRVKIFGRW